jgi:hypothetical protein
VVSLGAGQRRICSPVALLKRGVRGHGLKQQPSRAVSRSLASGFWFKAPAGALPVDGAINLLMPIGVFWCANARGSSA